MEVDGENRKTGHIQILIADETPIYGEGLRALLEEQPDFSVVGVAPDRASAIQMSRERQPDVLLLNVKFSSSDGMGVLDELQALKIPVRTLLLATTLAGPDLMRALLLGARGVVLKTSSTQALIDGIRGVMVGQYWIGAEMGASIMGVLRAYTRSSNGNSSKGPYGLTPRELEIVQTVVGGYSNAEIAKKYGLSEQTVKHHLSSIFDKVGVFNRVELALFAVNHRLVRDDS
jgi:two-component system, NarL family, nitrate/nitrite response regulator NarL